MKQSLMKKLLGDVVTKGLAKIDVCEELGPILKLAGSSVVIGSCVISISLKAGKLILKRLV